MDGQTVDRRMCVFVRAGVSEENVLFYSAAGSMKDGALIILSSEVYSHSNRCAFTLSKPSYILIDQRQPNLNQQIQSKSMVFALNSTAK